MISQISDISNRDGHATDEEKLASTSSGQKPTGAEGKGEPEDDLEYFECSNVPVSAINHAFSSSEAGTEANLHLSYIHKHKNAWKPRARRQLRAIGEPGPLKDRLDCWSVLCFFVWRGDTKGHPWNARQHVDKCDRVCRDTRVWDCLISLNYFSLATASSVVIYNHVVF